MAAELTVTVMSMLMNDTLRRRDPVQAFFDNLPAPEGDPYRLFGPLDATLSYNAAVMVFICSSRGHHSTDPDAEFLLEQAKESAGNPMGSLPSFCAQLGRLAISKDADLNCILDTTIDTKSRQLAYFRWIAEGRKDEASPFSESIYNNTPVSHAFLPKQDKSKCASCLKYGAKLKCSRCLIRIEGYVVQETSYCDDSCQKAHWKAHTLACREWCHISRAASIFREIFIHHLATFSSGVLVSVESNASMITATRQDDDHRTFQGDHHFQRFPSHLGIEKELTEAVVCLGRCGMVLTTMKPLFDQVMRGFCKQVEQVVFVPKNIHRPTQIYGRIVDMNSFRSHEVVRLTLPSGQQLAFDPTGSQFGWTDYISPWKIYERYRVLEVNRTQVIPPASPDQRINLFIEPRAGSGEISEEVDLAHETVANVVSSTILTKLLGFGGGSSLFAMKEVPFSAARHDIISEAKARIDDIAATWERSKQFKLYYSLSEIPCVTTSDWVYDCLKACWFTEEDYTSWLGKGHDKLYAEWERRNQAAMKSKGVLIPSGRKS